MIRRNHAAAAFADDPAYGQRLLVQVRGAAFEYHAAPEPDWDIWRRVMAS